LAPGATEAGRDSPEITPEAGVADMEERSPQQAAALRASRTAIAEALRYVG
jgi:hypothetical protein